jgi:hypothetical protein
MDDYEEEEEEGNGEWMPFTVTAHGDIFLAFGPDSDVKSAKAVIAPKFNVEEADIRIFYRGRSLGDAILLSKLQIDPGERLTVFLHDLSEIVLHSVCGISEAAKYVFTDVNKQVGDLQFELDQQSSVREVQEKVADALKVCPIQVGILVDGIRLNSFDVVQDVVPESRIFGFTVIDEALALYVTLIEQSGFEPGNLDEADRDRLNATSPVVMKQVDNEELANIDKAKGDLRIEDAVAIYLASGRSIDAIRAVI